MNTRYNQWNKALQFFFSCHKETHDLSVNGLVGVFQYSERFMQNQEQFSSWSDNQFLKDFLQCFAKEEIINFGGRRLSRYMAISQSDLKGIFKAASAEEDLYLPIIALLMLSSSSDADLFCSKLNELLSKPFDRNGTTSLSGGAWKLSGAIFKDANLIDCISKAVSAWPFLQEEKWYNLFMRKNIISQKEVVKNDPVPEPNPVVEPTHSSASTSPRREADSGMWEKEKRLNRVYSRIINGRTTRYLWELRLSQDQYSSLRDALCSYDFGSSRSLTKDIKAHAPKIALFLAEWYKREYNGRNGDNALGLIGLKTNCYKMVWEESGINGSYLLNSDSSVRWRDSLFLQGGFPILYCNNVDKFDFLFENIWDESGEIRDETIEMLSSSFTGLAISSSLSFGSLRDYYIYLYHNHELPCAVTDTALEPFRTFIQNMAEGKKAYGRKFIQHSWYTYTDSDSENLETWLRITLGKKADMGYIPYACLSTWGIQHPETLKEFELCIVGATEDGPREYGRSIRFVKTGNGDFPFLGDIVHNSYSILIPISDCKYYNIVLKVPDTGESYVVERIENEGWLLQYKTSRPYEWKSIRDRSSISSLLYNPDLFYADDDIEVSSKKIKNGGVFWCWVPINQTISLYGIETSEKCETFYRTGGSFSCRIAPLKGVLKYHSFNKVRRVLTDEDSTREEYVPLLCGKSGLSFTIASESSEGQASERKIGVNAVEIFFKQGDNYSFTLWDGNNSPIEGPLRIRCRYNGLTETKDVYYLRNDNPVIRQLSARVIHFHNINNLWGPTSDGYKHMSIWQGPEYTFHVPDHAPDEETYDFRVGTESDYIVLPVFNPKQEAALFMKGEIIKRVTSESVNIRIPYILRKNFKVRIIDSDGIRYQNCQDDLFFESWNMEQTEIKTNDIVEYYSVDNKHFRNLGSGKYLLVLGGKGRENYSFFYWSMKAEEDPVPIELTETKDGLVFQCPNANNQGMIFQGLLKKGPRHYVRPIYLTPFARAKRDIVYQQEDVSKSLEIATLHEVYYTLFPPIHKYLGLHKPQYLAKMVLESKGEKVTAKDFENLHRLGKEFNFIWLLLPVSIWKRVFKGDWLMVARRFLLSTPTHGDMEKYYLERIIDHIFADNVPSSFRRSGTLENQALQCMRGAGKDLSLTDPEQRVKGLEFLRTFIEDKHIYQKLFTLLMRETAK